MNTGSILVCSGSTKERQKKIDEIISQLDESLINKDHPDRLTISLSDTKKGIGINRIRSLINFMSTRPYSSKYKIAVIKPAEKMTAQAQNALLKILEEPPFYTVIILSSKTEDALLPTIISRCRKILPDIEDEDLFEYHKGLVTFKTLLGYNMGERLKLAENMAKKDEGFVIDTLEYWIKEERYEMTHNNRFEKYKNIELILSFLKDIEETNVNTRLALETLFMKV